jgi:hypothetical protein
VDRPVYRIFAASGVAYVLLVVLGNDVLGGGQSPDPGAARAVIAQWLTSQSGTPGLKEWASLYMECLGLLLLVVFISTLAATFRRVDGDGPVATAVLEAGATSVAIKLISVPIALAALYRAHEGIDIQLGAALIDINNFCFILTWGVDGLMLAALAVGALRYGALPRWLAWFTAVVAVALLIAPSLVAGPGFLAMLLFLIWTVVCSIRLAIRPVAGRATSAAAPPRLRQTEPAH